MFNIKSFFIRILVVVSMSAVICTTMASCVPITVDAVSLPSVSSITPSKLVDMALTRSGKVVNSDMRTDIVNQIRNVLNGTATSYKQWLEDNDLTNTTENFRAYTESDAYSSLAVRFVGLPLELGSFLSWITTGETTLDQLGTDIDDVLTETDISGNVTVPSETVNIINQAFNDVKGDYDNGWRYVDIIPSSDIPSTLFDDVGSYNNFKAYVDSSDNPTILFDIKRDTSRYALVADNSDYLNLVEFRMSSSSSGTSFDIYNTEWTPVYIYYKFDVPANQLGLKDSATFSNGSQSYADNYQALQYGRDLCYWSYPTGDLPEQYVRIFVFGKTSGRIIVYNSAASMKEYSLGRTPYYSTNRQYSDSVDNSFNVSGEYIQNNGGTFAYEQIREQINNSNVTNDNSVSNIVNDYSQTIINNYNGSGGSGSGGSGDSGDGEDNDGEDNDGEGNSLLDGIASIIGAIGEIIGFLLKVIGEAISLIANMLTTIFDLLTSLGAVFGSFSGLLGELFVFIPTELINLITTSISAVIVICVFKFFKK